MGFFLFSFFTSSLRTPTFHLPPFFLLFSSSPPHPKLLSSKRTALFTLHCAVRFRAHRRGIHLTRLKTRRRARRRAPALRDDAVSCESALQRSNRSVRFPFLCLLQPFLLAHIIYLRSVCIQYPHHNDDTRRRRKTRRAGRRHRAENEKESIEAPIRGC